MVKLLLKKIILRQEISSYYRKLHKLPGFSLLQSTDKQRGRYDIVSARPYFQLQINFDEINWRQKLFEFEAMIPQAPAVNDLPFQGGVIGYFSYDLGLKLAGIDSKQKKLAPGPMVSLGLYDWALIYDHQEKQGYIFAAMRDPNTKESIDEVLDLLEEENNPEFEMEFCTDFTPCISPDDYQLAFDSIQRDLKKGRCYQVNFTQPFMADTKGDSWAFYEQMAGSNPVPFAAYIKGEQENVLSFSPERFLFIDQGEMLSSPIKGTAPRSAQAAQDQRNKEQLFLCPKNRAENVMIVDLMRNDLGKIAKAGSVEVSALFDVQSFNGVHHLVSDVRGQLQEDVSLFEALLSSFPAGSITGAPKHEAMKVISELESYYRGLYCGSIGYISAHGRMDFNVAIRSIREYKNRFYLSAGGGIVLDSEADSEYGECLTKISAITHGH